MSQIPTSVVKELRTKTGVSVMQCKKALEETGGDIEKALVVLRKHAVSAAAKKAGRELGAGVVQAYIHSNNQVGVLIELACETDFVSKNEDFTKLAYDVSMHIAATNPTALRRDEVEEDSLKVAKAVFEKEAIDKPEDKRTKIVEGKLNAYFKETVLMEQVFIKDSNQTINDLIESAIQKFGEKIEIVRFARFAI